MANVGVADPTVVTNGVVVEDELDAPLVFVLLVELVPFRPFEADEAFPLVTGLVLDELLGIGVAEGEE